MDYQKYMNQGSGTSGSSTSGSQGGDYQKYMPQGGGKGGASKSGDYQQYMDYQKYMPGGGKTGGSQGGDYQQYMDYQKYMPQQGKDGKSGGGQGGDYQKYMSSGGGKSTGGQGGDYQKYYQKYMSQGGGKKDATVALISTDSKADGADGAKKYYTNYVPDVKNWTNRDEVKGAFAQKYASSYMQYVKQRGDSADTSINLNSMDTRKEADKYNKYYSKYVPTVKNWSNRDEVNDAFVKKYGGSPAKDAADKANIDGNSIAKDNAVEALYAASSSSDKVVDASSSLAPVPSKSLTASKKSVDAQAADETASLGERGAQKSLRLFLIIPAALVAGGMATMYNKVQFHRRHRLLQPLIES